MRRLNIEKTCFAQVGKALATIAMLLMTTTINAQEVVPVGTYFDPGGANNAYQIGDKQSYKICPDNSDKQVVQLEFTQYSISNGTTVSVTQDEVDCMGNITPITLSGVAGNSISNAPDNGHPIVSANSADGCLTVNFDATNATAMGSGYTLQSKEVDRPNYSFPLGGNTQTFSFSPEACNSPFDLTAQNIPVPTYTDANGCTLELAADCANATIASAGGFLTGEVGLGETVVTFTSPFTGEVATYVIKVYPKSLGCNDDINTSLSNSCVVILTPDIFLEEECDANNPNVSYEIQFQNPYTEIVGETVEGYPIADFSQVPCGTKINVMIRRTVQLDCGSQTEQKDWCWSILTIEDRVAPEIVGTPFIAEIPCYYDTESLLEELNKVNSSAKEISLYPARVDQEKAGNTVNTLTIPAIADSYDVLENCDFDGFKWSDWVEVTYSCTEDAFNIDDYIQNNSDIIDVLQGILNTELGDEAVFSALVRTIEAVDKCGNKSSKGFQIVRIVQPDIVAPLYEVSLNCEESGDPIEIYNKWASDPVKYAHLGAAIPNFDPTPLNNDFGVVLNIEDVLAITTLTDGSGDEIPAFMEHADCGYAIDWEDSRQIKTCTNSYKLFREWTIYNWCDGHLELIDLIPQIVKVEDTTAPYIDGDVIFTSVDGDDIDPTVCLADAILQFEIKDECSTETTAYISINGGTEILLVPEGNGYRLSNVTVGEPLDYVIRLIDDCSNQGTTVGTITLEDDVPPTAICEQFRTVGMGLECTTTVRAEAFDDGSFDNCGQVSFSVAYLDAIEGNYTENHSVFQPFVTFTKEMMDGCEGTKTVIFRVADGAGVDLNNDGDYNDENERHPNYNYCEVEVTLQDIIAPTVQDQTIVLGCDAPATIALTTAILEGEDAVQSFLNSGEFIDPNGVAYIAPIADNCENSTFRVSAIDATAFDVDCRQGTVQVVYQAVDACGNVSLPAVTFINVVSVSNWEMHFPEDILVEDCSVDISLPAPLNLDDILINNGCDEWGLNMMEEVFEGEGTRDIVRSYHLVNFCTWNPSNTEIAVVERPEQLILDNQIRNYTVALRYQDNRTVELDANGNVKIDADGDAIVTNDNLPDGINDIDDGNEDDDFVSNSKLGSNLKSFDYSNPLFLYKARADRYDFSPIRIPFSSEQLERINDADEAETYDYYDVTDLPFDGDFAVIDNFDFPTRDVEVYTATSQFSGETQQYVSANDYGNIMYRQIIRIIDTNAPVIEVPEFDAFCAEDGCFGEAIVRFKATDPCDGSVECDYSGVLYYRTDDEQPFELGSDQLGEIINLGDGNFEIKGTYPIGFHQITIVAKDDAGNTSTYTFEFEVIDCKAPVAKCLLGLSVDLMQDGTVTIGAEWFDKGSYDNCSDKVTFTFADPAIYPDSTTRTFSCQRGELGLTAVSLWVMDEAGNTSFCETFVDLQRNPQNGQFDLCPTQGASIGGVVLTEEGSSVEKAEVNLSGNMDAMYPTATDGEYQFIELETGYDYTITPHKDNDQLNGVTTYDLLLLSKHILGTATLDSPYKLIAADANNSGTITTYDMILIRKLILGVNEHLPNNTSWRFIPADYEFTNPTNPFAEDFPEIMNVNDLAKSYMAADFIGIKVGDLNGSSIANSSEQIEGRSTNSAFRFVTQDATLDAGETMTVTFTAEDIAAYQFTMELEGLEVLEVKDAEAANFGLFEHKITASWNADWTNTYSDNDIMFSLLVRATERTRLSDALKITSSKTQALAYNQAGAVQSVALHFASAQGYKVTQNYPNPFSTETTIAITAPITQAGILTVQDLNGRVVKTISLELKEGYNEVQLSGKDLAKGVYYYTVSTSDFSQTYKMAVL